MFLYQQKRLFFPPQIIEFFGITLDTQKFEASFPSEKIEKCRSYLHIYLTRDRCTLKDMQSLVGTLNFACTVVQPGRAFLRRMINLTCTVAEHQKFFSISEEAKLDILMLLNLKGSEVFMVPGGFMAVFQMIGR